MKKLFKKIGAGFAAASGACLMTAAVVAMMGCTDNGGNVANGVSEETSIAEGEYDVSSLKGQIRRSMGSFDLESLDSAAIESTINGSSLYLKKVRFCTLDSETLAISDRCSVGSINDYGYEVEIESKGWRYGLLEVDVSEGDESRLLEMGYTEDLLEQSRYKMHAIIDAKNPTASNVNILTAWKYYQVKKLVESGVGVAAAMARAESDVLASINVFGEYESFGLMDFSGNTKSDLLLMAANYLMNVPSVSDGDVVSKSMRKYVGENEIRNEIFWRFMGLEKPSEEIIDQVERFVTNYFAVDVGLGRCEESNDGQIVRADEYDFGNANLVIKDLGFDLKCEGGLWGWYVPELEHTVGTMTDSRDGHVYKTTTFTVNGTVQTWMAEDLKFDEPGSECVMVDSHENCEIYGRLYTWASVMQLDTAGFVEEVPNGIVTHTFYGDLEQCFDMFRQGDYGLDSLGVYYHCVNLTLNHKKMLESVDIQNHQGICPDGWRIPSVKDWKLLAEYIGDDEHLAVKLMKKDSWRGIQIRSVVYGGRFSLSLRTSDVIDFSAVPMEPNGRNARYAEIPNFDATDIELHGTSVVLISSYQRGGFYFYDGNIDYEYYEGDEYGPAGLFPRMMGVRCIKNQ